MSNTRTAIMFMDKVYPDKVGGGSGGTEVIPNPSEEPTAALETIQIEDTVYNIPGGLEPIEIEWSAYNALPMEDKLDPTKQYYVKNIPGGEGGSVNIEEMTQLEYDALPDTKLSDDTVRFAYYDGGTPQLDPNYTYVTYGQDDEIIIRIYHEGEDDEEVLWFFNGWNQTSGDMAIPSELTVYAPTSTDPISSKSYLTSDMETQVGYIGFYQNHIRSWDVSQANLYTGIVYGVVDPTSGNKQNNKYYNPYVYLPLDATRHIYLNGRQYSNEGDNEDIVTISELTSTEYDLLPDSQKQDDKTIYFINDLVSREIEVPVNASEFTNSKQGAMNIQVVNEELIYTWDGGSQIGASSYRPTIVPSNAIKIKYKITTGTSYSTTAQRFKIAIGVKANYNTSDWATSEDTNWLAVDIQNTQNTVYEGEVDLSNITTDSYLMIGAHGWNVTFNEITLVEEFEPTGSTKIMYKDVEYGTGNSSGGDSYSETELFVNTTPTTIPPASITLDDDFTNYDILYFDIIRQADNKVYHIGKELLVSTLAVGDSFQFLIYSGEYFSFTITDSTTFTRLNYGGDYLYKIIGIKIEGSGGGSSSSINYSTDEYEVGTWIDGKPLYQKTIEISSIPSNDSNTFSYGISDAITIRDYKCIIVYGSGSEQLYWDINTSRPDNNNSAIYGTATKTGFFIRTFTAWTASANLTIWYTKDND